MIKISRLTVAFLAVTITANAFLYQQRNFAHRSFGNKASSSLDASYDPYSSGESCNNNYKSRTDLRQFLTQRSIQSFVFLLNQCKEGATIRWLEVRPCREKGGWLTHRRLRHHGRQRVLVALFFSEFTPFFLFFLPSFVCLSNEQKQLDFKKIDSYHGTGAFNTTLFPEWDSIFLQLVMQDQETIIIEVEAQKKSHRGWAHQGNYLDGISSSGGHEPDASSSSTQKSSPPDRKRGPSGSYLAHLNSAPISARDSNPGGASSSAAPKMKPKWKPTSKTSGAAGNYLESLSQPKEQTSDNSNDMNLSMKSNGDGTGAGPINMKQNPNGEVRASSGMRGGNYLDGLSSNTIESANQDEAVPQSNGLIENPHIESVRPRIQLSWTWMCRLWILLTSFCRLHRKRLSSSSK